MIRFLLRRLVLAIGILFAISVVTYALLTMAMDPLRTLRESTALNKAEQIAALTRRLRLDEPWYVRYWDWLTKFVTGDPGVAWQTGQKVKDMVPSAIATSVQLVAAATFIALLIGVTIGVVSALRQYTGFDYAITLVSFVLYALPVFWVAVLLKEYLAIGVNDYLADPQPNWPLMLALSVIAGLFWMGAIGGPLKRRLIVFGLGFGVTLVVLAGAVLSGWILNPQLSIVGVLIFGVAAALVFTLMFTGLRNKRAVYSALTMAAIGGVLYYPLQFVFVPQAETFASKVGVLGINFTVGSLVAFGGILLTIAVGCLVGYLFGGDDRNLSMRIAALTGLVSAGLIWIDQIMQWWAIYFDHPSIRGRPVATIGAVTPGFNEGYWMMQIDKATHLLLPTIALVLISFAGYVRYERGATLEVLSQDYIRTARSKGLSERVVIVRHALRNALMPLASIIPVDIVSLMGGAVITETIFGWSGMGKFFIDSLGTDQIDPVMFYIMFTGALAMIANLMADLLYGLLDPRIRINA